MTTYTIQYLKENLSLYKHVRRIAQFESEVDLGTNPLNKGQAKVSKLTPSDFNYINTVNELVQQRLNNPIWLTETIRFTLNFHTPIKRPEQVKFNDELYKSGRGILQDFIAFNFSQTVDS